VDIIVCRDAGMVSHTPCPAVRVPEFAGSASDRHGRDVRAALRSGTKAVTCPQDRELPGAEFQNRP
jgi:hypothetical protein